MNRTEEIEKLSKKIEEKLRDNNEDMNLSEFLSEVRKISFDNKYALWIIKQYLSGELYHTENFGRLKEAINIFHKHKNRLPVEKRNIMNFSKFSDFEDIAEDLSFFEKQNMTTKEQKEKIYSETEFLYNGPDGKILIPKSKEASIFWGQGTRWCTASTEYNAFENYSSRGPLYILILPEKDDLGREVKYQFHLDNTQFMDMADKRAWENSFDEKYIDIIMLLFDIATKKFENNDFKTEYYINPDSFEISSKIVNFKNGKSIDIQDIAFNKIKIDENLILFLTQQGLLSETFIEKFLENNLINENKFITALFNNPRYFSFLQNILDKKIYWEKFLSISKTNSHIHTKLKEFLTNNFSRILIRFFEKNQMDFFYDLKKQFTLSQKDYVKILGNISQNKLFSLQEMGIFEKTKIFEILKNEKNVFSKFAGKQNLSVDELFSSSILTPEQEKYISDNLNNIDLNMLKEQNCSVLFHIFSKMLINGKIEKEKYLEICDTILTVDNYMIFKNKMDIFAKNYSSQKLNDIFNFDEIDNISSITKSFFYFYNFKNKSLNYKLISNYENFEKYLLDLKKADVSQEFENIFYNISSGFFSQEKNQKRNSTNFATFITEKFLNRDMDENELLEACQNLFNYLKENHLYCSLDNIWKNTNQYQYNFRIRDIMKQIYEIDLDEALYEHVNYNEEPRNAFDLEHINNQELADFMINSINHMELYYKEIKNSYSFDIKNSDHKSRLEEFLVYFALRINEQKDEETLKTIINSEANKKRIHRPFGFTDKKVFLSWLENCIDYTQFDTKIFFPVLDDLLKDDENKFIVIFSPIFKNYDCVNYLKSKQQYDLANHIEQTIEEKDEQIFFNK